jgi:tripartite-type tricarboxylate transporter receptor subunit TctC
MKIKRSVKMKIAKSFILFVTVGALVMFSTGMLYAGGGGEAQKSTPASTSAQKVDFPTKPITLIVPYAAGGGSDVGARLISAEAEKILGKPIAIVNKPGANGWLGWTETLQAAPDGYTITHINTPSLITGYLDPQQNRTSTVDNFAPILLFVVDDGIIAVNPKEKRFTTLNELIAYAKNTELTATSTGVASDDDIVIKKLNQALGTKFIPVNLNGAGETIPAVMGGHVDVLVANVGEVKAPAENGEIKPLAVFSEERTPVMPDVPTVKEITGVSIVGASARGLAAPAGVDPQVMQILIDAYSKAAKNPDFLAKMAEQGLNVVSIAGNDYMANLKTEEGEVKELAPLFGWKK